jgi:hypothetical protein
VEGAILAGQALADDSWYSCRREWTYLVSGAFNCVHDFLGGVVEIVGGDDVQTGLGNDLLAELDVGAFEANDQRNARLVSFTAAITPSAITSHFMMPPKMFTRMPFTFGSS